MRALLLSAVVLLNGTVQPAVFESAEHEQLGTMSLMIAERALDEGTLARSRKDQLESSVGELIKGLCSESTVPCTCARGDELRITYGTITLLVDYLDDPYEILEALAADERELDQTCAHRVLVDKLVELYRNKGAYYAATHRDYNHFQGRILYSFGLWHGRALQEARSGHLFRALVLNAFADHFIQEMFAPGHIMTPRQDRSHDLAAIALHDLYNARGMDYLLDDLRPLAPLLNAASKLACEHGGSLQVPYSDSASQPQFALRIPGCDFRALLKQIDDCEAGRACTLRQRCLGDGRLSESPGQAALVAAYAARSALDVLKTWSDATTCSDAVTDSFDSDRLVEGASWQANTVEESGELHSLVTMRVPFCGLRCEFSSSRREGSQDYRPVDANLDADINENPIYWSFFGGQSVFKRSAASIRVVWGVERLFVQGRGLVVRDDSWWPKWLGYGVGATGTWNLGSSSVGPVGSLVFVNSSLNYQFSLSAGGRYHASEHEWTDFEQVRLDWGMHVFSLYAAVGWDGFIRDGSKDDGASFETGLSFALPLTQYGARCRLFD